MVSIETYNNSFKDDWNKFIDISKNSTFLFKRDFMDYHSDKFKDHSLLVYKNSELVALFPLNISDGKFISSGVNIRGYNC